MRFHVGSVTKSMTSTLLAILIEDGMIESWGSKLGHLIPSEASGTPYEDVTLRQLVSHQAGIPRDVPLLSCFLYAINPSKDPRKDRTKTTKNALKSTPVNAPGTEWSYSNWGYIIAGHIVEEVTGMTWEAALASFLFEPLGIRLDPDPISKMTGAPNSNDDPWGHYQYFGVLSTVPCNPDQPLYPFYPFTACDNPTVYSAPGRFSGPQAAMARYLAFHLSCHRGEHSGLLLSQASCQTLHSPANASVADYYGYGWFINNDRGEVVYHGGSNTINFYRVWLDLDGNRAYAAMTNQAPTESAAVALNQTVETMIALGENQEDCSARIPSSVYIVH
eukprot:Sro2239_g320240.2  (333) ;mRNA; r:10473-11471